MHNELCERLGIEFPIFAFTHCRDVAAAVTNAGGMGVLGAVGFSAEELEVELNWLDEHVGDRPYGVDIVIPGKYEGMGEIDPVKLEEELKAMIPEEHRTFAKKILADHGVPELEGGPRRELLGWTAATAAPLVEVILRHPKVKLVANALGTPPDDVIAQVHEHGMLMAALAGSVKIINWLTVPTAMANLIHAVGGLFFPVNFYAMLQVTRLVGIAIIAVSLPLLWWRYRQDDRTVLTGVAWAMLVVVLFVPGALPWYYSWPLAVVAPLAQSRAAVAAIAGFSTWIMVVFKPDGAHGMYSWIHVLVATACAAIAWYTLSRPPVPEPAGPAD